jgi:hypothetical protein
MNHYYAEIQEKPIDPEEERKRTVNVLLEEEIGSERNDC